MRNALPILMVAVFWTAGCSSTHRVCAALRQASLGLTVERCEARRAWLKDERGRGVEVEVWAARDACDYERDLRLELDGAARVCAALSKSEAALEWDYVDLRFFNRYRFAGRGARNVVGIARVIVRREVLLDLCARDAPLAEYAPRWRFLSGHKDQPDSRELLSW